MAKLYFRYGAMNSGKSTALLQAAYNYEERGQEVLLAKPRIDTKGDDQIVSRLGVTRAVDFVIEPRDDIYSLFEGERASVQERTGLPVSCLLVDEAQFLTERQVDDLLRIAILENVPVLAYGIRTDFQTVAFPGSRRLLEVAHSLEELKTICRCGRKAVFNARRVGDTFTFAGDQVAIDESADAAASRPGSGLGASGSFSVSYESLCGACYLEESGGTLSSGREPVIDFVYDRAPDPDFM
ncbi:thymidine kinase [Salinibacterium sp. SYSU T00001]|uniref:thymidine kinase n=1 Tax=Homoserinimonas sedimenticola TaxID=2986805 RepID=UPI00223565C4|nr:thymidine kinase [Salinibacterium sedimenticola]MCW4385174.1 thymidine kinase [Salinibacterium sedimenticola]